MNPRPPAPEAGTLPPEPHPDEVSSNKPINLITTFKIMQVIITKNYIFFSDALNNSVCGFYSVTKKADQIGQPLGN